MGIIQYVQSFCKSFFKLFSVFFEKTSATKGSYCPADKVASNANLDRFAHFLAFHSVPCFKTLLVGAASPIPFETVPAVLAARFFKSFPFWRRRFFVRRQQTEADKDGEQIFCLPWISIMGRWTAVRFSLFSNRADHNRHTLLPVSIALFQALAELIPPKKL